MPQTGELVGLQRVAGSGKQEFPGRLGPGTGHGDLQFIVAYVSASYTTAKNLRITSNIRVHSLWKSVDIVENPHRACSACHGDYEDPDRSAWEEDSGPETQAEVGDEPEPRN